MRGADPRQWLPLLVIFALAIGSGLYWGTDFAQGGDAQEYRRLAENILDGHGYSLSETPPYEPTARRAPGYPLFLAAVYAVGGRSDGAILWAQSILWGIGCVLLARLAGSIFDRQAGWLAGLIVAVHPVLAGIAGGILTETLYIVCVIQLVWFFHRALLTSSLSQFALAGILCGAAAMIRPLTGGLMLFLWAGIWICRRQIVSPVRGAMVMAAAALLCVMPWQMRNIVTFRALVPIQVQSQGMEVWISTLPFAELPTKRYSISVPAWQEKYPIWRNHFLYHEEGRKNETIEQLKWERALTSDAIQRVRHDPASYVLSRLKNYPYLWLYSGGGAWLSSVTFGDTWRQRDVLRFSAKLGFLLATSVLPIALAASLWLLPAPPRAAIPLWVVPLFIAIIHLPLYVEHRYALPAEPFIWGLASGRLRMLWGSNQAAMAPVALPTVR